VGSGCGVLVKRLDTAKKAMGNAWRAAPGGNEYREGYRVCLTEHGGNVHDGKERHQRCVEGRDDHL
jgi:hypothetical protein